MVDTALIPEKTVITAKGDGSAVELGGTGNRVFLLSLNITDVIEQESIDVSIFGSKDGQAWGAKPIITFPQKFYRGQHPLLLDLAGHTDVSFVRAHWEVNRWGRGEPTPRFEVGLAIREVTPEILKEVGASAQAGR